MLIPLLLLSSLTAAQHTANPDLKSEGAFGFPQARATVLCDTPDLRLSVFNDGEHLFVQAVLWNDGDDAAGETRDGRAIGDRSSLIVDVDADRQVTAKLDRTYHLNPWPSRAGLQGSSQGRGSIAYLSHGDAKVRVDTYLIPASELGRKPGDPVRIAFLANSTVPEFTANSVGFESDKTYHAHHLPWESFHDVTLAPGPASIDAQLVPEGRDTIVREAKAKPPALGEVPPAFAAESWINWKGDQPPTPEFLRGKVVVVEFWATWCGPCIAGIPHLNEIHEKHAKDGLVLLSLTDQSRAHVEEFVKQKDMRYTVGVKSQTADAYGVSGIPAAFVIGRDGKLLWSGHPAREEFERAIVEALKQTF